MQIPKLYLPDAVIVNNQFILLFVCIEQPCLKGRSRKLLKRFRGEKASVYIVHDMHKKSARNSLGKILLH